MKRKIIAVLTALAVALTPASVFALDTQGDKAAIKEFTKGGYTYYDIYNGQIKDRPEIDDKDKLIDQTLYGKKEGQSSSAAKYWATFAADVFAANPQSYRSFDDDGGHGSKKSTSAYKTRFSKDVKKSEGYYGNLQSALYSKERKRMSTGAVDKFKRTSDINAIASGKQSARNLSEVQDAAFQLLVDVNPAKAKKSDFKKQNELKALSDDTSSGNVVYHLLATRDRVGGTYRYIYNCFGIAYSDFQAVPVSGKNGEGVTTALKDYDTLDKAADDVKAGKTIEGFAFDDSSNTTAASIKNNESEAVTQSLTIDASQDESLSSEISHLESYSFSEEENVEFNFGDDQAAFHAGFGFAFTQEQLFEDGMSSSNSTSHHEETGSTQEITIPAHTAVKQYMSSNRYNSTVNYDCPVVITYKVTIFSMNGEYYDDNAAVKKFNSVDYEQRSFIAQLGNEEDNTGAVENLNSRMAKDSGFDKTHGTTRGILVNHGYSADNRDWDNPWVDHLDYSKISTAAKEIGLSPKYQETIDFVSSCQPISITGAVLERSGTAVDGFIGEALPIYPLKTVGLKNSVRSKVNMTKDQEFYLSKIALEGTDSKKCEFYGFSRDQGYWAVVNKSGEPIENSKTISVKKNQNGDDILKGLQPGKAYIKYFVDEKAYKLSNDSYVNPEEVETPQILVTVQENRIKAERIDTPETVEFTYTAGTATDIDTIEELSAVVVDENGKTMDVDVEWTTVDSGIKISDNILTVEKAGTYTLTAQYEDISSSPVNLVAIPADKAGKLKKSMNTFLSCSSEQCSTAEACLLIKNKLGQDSSINELIYTEALIQLSGDKSGGESEKEYELQAVIWAMQNDLFKNIDRAAISIGSGISEVEFAQMAYNAAVKFGRDVSCDDVINEYKGTKGLNNSQKEAMNWAISKGALSDEEENSKSIDSDRIITDGEAKKLLQ